jgi:hypothetical protein
VICVPWWWVRFIGRAWLSPCRAGFRFGWFFKVRQLPRSVEQRFLRVVEAEEDFDSPLALAGPSSTPCPAGALKFHGDTGVAPDGWRHNQSGPLPDLKLSRLLLACFDLVGRYRCPAGNFINSE